MLKDNPVVNRDEIARSKKTINSLHNMSRNRAIIRVEVVRFEQAEKQAFCEKGSWQGQEKNFERIPAIMTFSMSTT